jgi:hypothetical protein
MLCTFLAVSACVNLERDFCLLKESPAETLWEGIDVPKNILGSTSGCYEAKPPVIVPGIAADAKITIPRQSRGFSKL